MKRGHSHRHGPHSPPATQADVWRAADWVAYSVRRSVRRDLIALWLLIESAGSGEASPELVQSVDNLVAASGASSAAIKAAQDAAGQTA